MYKEIIQKIKAILEDVTAVKSIYPYALREGEKISSYPAVIYFPTGSSNQFETNADNFKEYNFNLYVICSIEQIGSEEVATNVLPNVIDKVIAKFDKEWSMNAVSGQRTWVQVSSMSDWTLPYSDAGIEMSAQLTVTIKTLTEVN